MIRGGAAALLLVAGVAGGLGVGAAATAAHGGDPRLATASDMLLFHAAALVGLAALISMGGGRLLMLGAAALTIGLALFTGDLAARALLETRLFPLAAPIGGVGLMAGWALVAIAGAGALFRR